MPAPSSPSTYTRKRHAPGLGESVLRPDAPAKVQGKFAFSSDLWMDRMLWGRTLRSPFPHARITRLDPSSALLIPGVRAVITNDDLWGSRTFGLEHHDQPVFANDVARYHGEPIAAVAADHPEIAARAAAAITVEYEELEPLSDPEVAIRPETPPIHRQWARSLSRVTTRSACRTRHSSVRSRDWRCPHPTAVWTCTSPRSGCMWTGTRSPPA
jgi:CO/xanthine dehydrogenase Mo-binding subunit